MWISTFHALCARLLRREAPHIGLSRDFTIYDSADQQSVDQAAAQGIRARRRNLPAADGARPHQPRQEPDGGPGDASSNSLEPAGPRDRQLYAGYIKALKEASALDFDDLLLKTVDLFEQAPAVRERYAQQFRFVMVDEYQDTNRPQYLLIKQLAGMHRNLGVVGDPDQSIYKWRGADLRNILDFEHDFSGSHHRPPRAELPLDAGHPRRRVGGDREQPQPQGEDALDRPQGRRQDPLFRGADELEEADYITRDRAPCDRTTTSTRTMAVLYRTNAQSRAVEDALRQAGIAYVVLGGVGFYERKEIKDALSYLKLILNPHDDVALRRVINVPARGIGKGVMDALEQVQIAGESTATCRRCSPACSPTVAPTRCGRSW